MIRNGPQQINAALTAIDNALNTLATTTANRLSIVHENKVLTIGGWTVTDITFPVNSFTGSGEPTVVVSNLHWTACPLHIEIIEPPTNTGFRVRLVAPSGQAYPAAGTKMRLGYIAMKG
jgi:hypothetical protein